MIITDARIVWDSLKSIICVYKPAQLSCERIRTTIINAVITDLNRMDTRPPIDFVSIEGDPSTDLTVNVKPNLADHPLVVGPRYQHDDLKCSWSNYLGKNTSGVLLVGLRQGTKIAKYLRENHPTRSYRIRACLGQATENGFVGGKVVERSTWRHVHYKHMEQLLASIQASHQKQMFKSSGVDLQSQTAYDLAVQGPIRPSSTKLPVIYGIKCVDFEPPDFTIELQCINEYEVYLRSLIQDIGAKLHSTAHCTGIQCIRHSYFTLDDALLKKHWSLPNIISNMEACEGILEKHENLLRQKSAILQ